MPGREGANVLSGIGNGRRVCPSGHGCLSLVSAEHGSVAWASGFWDPSGDGFLASC